MASDIFRKSGHQRESLDAKHKASRKCSRGPRRAAKRHHGAAAAGVRARRAQRFQFHPSTSTRRPRPVESVCDRRGVHREATITVQGAQKTGRKFLIIKMNDILITSVNPSGAGDSAATAESVALQCAKVDLEYKPQKADGSLDAGIHFKYDIKGNKEG